MKSTVCLSLLALTLSVSAKAGSVRIYNNDSKAHVVKLKCNGSSKTLQVSASATSTYTNSSTASSCDVVGGSVSFPSTVMNDGEAWKFKNSTAQRKLVLL